MSTLIPPTPAAYKSAEQHQEAFEQDSFNHLLYKVLKLTSQQVQDLNGWMEHRGIPNFHEAIAQNFRKPHELEDNLKFITHGKPGYIQFNVMISLSLMISYIKHRRYSSKSKYFGPFYYIQIDPQDYDEWHTTPPEDEIHFQTPSKLGSPTTPRSNVSSEASESYITLTNFKKGIKRDASAYPIFKNEKYNNTFIRHFKATAKAQGLNSLMDPNFTPGSDEYEQQLFEEQQDFLYSVLISSLTTESSEALVKDHEGDAQLILELLHEHHTGNSQYSRAEINRITKSLTNIKFDDTWRGTNESFLMHYNDQLRLLHSLVDSDGKLPDNTRVTFLESAVESVPDLRRVKITDNVLQAQLDSTRPISYRSYFDLLKDAAFHLDQATKRGNKIRHTNVHFSGPNDEDEHQNLSSDDNQVIQQENVCSEPPEPLSYSLFQSHSQGSSTSNTLHTLMDWIPVKSLTNPLVTPCLMHMVISMSTSLPTSTPSWMHLQEIVGHTQKSLLFSQPISIRVHPKRLTGKLYAHFLHGHPHPASRTLSMSPPGMELHHTPRITSKSTLSLAILFSTSPDAVTLLQQTPSSLTLLLLMMVQPWPNSSVAVVLLSVMHVASNQPNNSSTPSLITSENGEPWIPSSVMEANMKSPS